MQHASKTEWRVVAGAWFPPLLELSIEADLQFAVEEPIVAGRQRRESLATRIRELPELKLHAGRDVPHVHAIADARQGIEARRFVVRPRRTSTFTVSESSSVVR